MMLTDVFEIRWSKCKHVYKPVGSFINNRVCQYVNTTDLIVIEHYIAI